MSMLSFLPWATTTERLVFGSFHLGACGDVLASREIPHDLRDSIGAILEAYGFRRDVDRASVPLLRHENNSFTADLTDDEVAEYFAFRTRLAFASLAARQFFSHRYCNSDNLRLIIQGFTPERAGGALITTRRRDGTQRSIVPRGTLRVPPPMHVSPNCQLPLDLDSPLLRALESAKGADSRLWPALEEGMSLFVGANTDSPDAGLHSELVDTVSAFSRLAGAWDEKGTIRWFLATLPVPRESDAQHYGPKAAKERVKQSLSEGESIRAAWLSDAYRLRSQYGHGHVDSPSYGSIWSAHEHLLLGAVAFPLTVKWALAREGFYALTRMDLALNETFDTLATLEPFTEPAVPEEDKRHPWHEVMTRTRLRQLAHAFEAALEDQPPDEAANEARKPGQDPPSFESHEGPSESPPGIAR